MGTRNLHKSLSGVIHSSNNFASTLSTPLALLKQGVAHLLRCAFGEKYAYCELRRFLRSVAGKDGSVSVAEVFNFLKSTSRNVLSVEEFEEAVPSTVLDSALKIECRMHKDRAHWHAIVRLLRHEMPECRRNLIVDFISELILQHGAVAPPTSFQNQKSVLQETLDIPSNSEFPNVRDIFIPLSVVKSLLGKDSVIWEIMQNASKLDLKAAENRTKNVSSQAEVMITPSLLVEAYKDFSASLGSNYDADMMFARIVPSISSGIF
eukprot:GDKK01069487.1.p1 GENE.GDKK01069487.1~~GDKK01069487.1.p1  ORF type:complete len:264 (+),score=31.81 GDKK01069487.1:1-792(+)